MRKKPIKDDEKEDCDCPACSGDLNGAMGIGVPMPCSKEMLESFLEKAKNRTSGTLNEHYGVSEEQYDKFVREMLAEMVLSEKRSNVLDKFFKDCDAETRVKIIAFSEAIAKLSKMLDYN